MTPELETLLATVPAPAGADIVTRDVSYDRDGSVFEGYLAVDAATSGPRPAVVIVHDWFGISDVTRVRAQMYARLGYAAFAVDVYGAGVRPADGDAAQAEAGRYYGDTAELRRRVAAGFEVAADIEEVDAALILVLGYCFGGMAALEFARTGAPAAGFASFHGALVTHGGEGVGSIAAPILVMTGGSDPVVPDAAVAAFEDELRTRPDLDWQVVTYAGAPHAFSVPGGNYRERADRRSWDAFARFAEELVGG